MPEPRKILVKTTDDLRDELDKRRNRVDRMPVVARVEGNRHKIEYVQTVPPNPGAPKGEFEIVIGEGIGE